MSFLKNLNWRFATKKFNSEKKVTEKNLKAILDSIRLAPSSFGLQTYHVYVVSDQKIKNKMKLLSYMQSQVSDAPYVLVFCGRSDVLKRIDDYADLNVKKNIVDVLKIKGVSTFMKTAMKGKTPQELMTWGEKQAYIALGYAMAACAELKIDSCPMEGFNSKGMDKLLNIPPHMKSCVLLPIGYRKEDPSRKKLRFPKEDLFSFVN